MPQFTLHRNYVLRTTKGHAVAFKKGVPTNVPPVCVGDAVAIGALPVDPADGDILGDGEKAPPALLPAERKAKIFEAFGIMKTRGERGDFTASGVPNAKRLPPLTSFEVTSKERDECWREYLVLAQEAHEQSEMDHKVAVESMED